jgi:E3 ubiquitin-protein ligase RNF115/126
MAEATVAPNSSSRFFCHKCDQDITPLPEFVCPRCRSGFIEELSSDVANGRDVETVESDEANHAHPPVPGAGGHDLVEMLENIYGSLHNRAPNAPATRSSTRQQASQRHVPSSSTYRAGHPHSHHYHAPTAAAPNFADSTQTLEGIFQHILNGVANGQMMNEGTQFFAPVSQHTAGGRRQVSLDFPLFQVLHGNPADYAWGTGGLDAVITQLLNQLDASGPAPMTKEEIDQIVFVQITQEDVERNLQCSVCMEDYKVLESVRKLNCTHVFHNDCIVPWLQMHATCPICRVSTSKSDQRSSGQGPDTQPRPGPGANNQSTSSPMYYEIPDYD